MYLTNRCISALGAIAVAVVGLGACGSGDSGEIVAQVAGVGSISKATLDHWIPVEAAVLYQENPTKPVPKGVLPDPPNYTACIAYLKTTRQKLSETGPKPTAEQLKSRCGQRLAELQELTLNTLIGWDWLIAAGQALGMSASTAEVKQRFTDVNKRSYPKGSEFTTYLKLTGQTVQDMMFRYRVQVFEAKIIQKQEAMQKLLPKGLTTAQQQQSVFTKFAKFLPPGKQWAAITTCRKGFVVSACKEYTGSQPPGIPN
jgi:foldase protein PrsA